MSEQGAEKVIAVDVGSQDNNNLTNYGDHISGWYILWSKLNPLAKKIRVCTVLVLTITGSSFIGTQSD